MTIREAIERKIQRIRATYWTLPQAYIKLPLLPDGSIGYHGILYQDPELEDRYKDGPLSIPMHHLLNVCGGFGEPAWEEYNGPLSEQDR